ncbi:MAG: PAB-dependent poly(A)-specific ribonuclease subunit 3 [Piccolia ochrophora]|nr:MAG: PAB-dependent poly(A)-specific ribonuclease subunit 3 [Piccolia ochrophora]
MAGAPKAYAAESRLAGSSPRPKGRGCAFNHDSIKISTPSTQADSVKKRLNVDSPTFTPTSLSSNGQNPAQKRTGISPKAAGAAPFTPQSINAAGTVTPPAPSEPASSDWTTAEVQDFVPQNFDANHLGDSSGANHGLSAYDPFAASSGAIGGGASTPQGQINPYAQDTSSIAGMGASYYQGAGTYTQPLQYHLYAPLGPHRENLLAYQRAAHDFFLSDSLREELQRKAEASLQVLPSSALPAQIDHFHSLVPLDTSNQKNTSVFGYPTWIYKAVSSKDGNLYALRRLEGYRLTNEKSIRSVQTWKRIHNGNIVTIHDAFTTGTFGDRSLVFVMDYHPLSKTLSEQHFSPVVRFTGRSAGTHIPEQVLWAYIVQLASALKVIHGTGLAARLLDPSKILLTSKNRLRINACAILDVTQHDTQLTVPELQQDDLLQFGRLMLSLASNNPHSVHNMQKAMEHLARSYSAEMKDCIFWLLAPAQAQSTKSIDQFLQGIAGQLAATFNNTLHLDDQLHSELNRELENARIVRLMAKLNFINERPEFDHDRQWSETGDRYFLKLFRDYVFHQVDTQGNPVIDLAHVLFCLAKLDAGVDEKISLVSRDEQNCLIVSYKELKRGVETAFQELVRAGKRP